MFSSCKIQTTSHSGAVSSHHEATIELILMKISEIVSFFLLREV